MQICVLKSKKDIFWIYLTNICINIYHNDSDIAEHSVGVVLKGTKKAHIINIRKRSNWQAIFSLWSPWMIKFKSAYACQCIAQCVRIHLLHDSLDH